MHKIPITCALCHNAGHSLDACKLLAMDVPAKQTKLRRNPPRKASRRQPEKKETASRSRKKPTPRRSLLKLPNPESNVLKAATFAPVPVRVPALHSEIEDGELVDDELMEEVAISVPTASADVAVEKPTESTIPEPEIVLDASEVSEGDDINGNPVSDELEKMETISEPDEDVPVRTPQSSSVETISVVTENDAPVDNSETAVLEPEVTLDLQHAKEASTPEPEIVPAVSQEPESPQNVDGNVPKAVDIDVEDESTKPHAVEANFPAAVVDGPETDKSVIPEPKVSEESNRETIDDEMIEVDSVEDEKIDDDSDLYDSIILGDDHQTSAHSDNDDFELLEFNLVDEVKSDESSTSVVAADSSEKETTKDSDISLLEKEPETEKPEVAADPKEPDTTPAEAAVVKESELLDEDEILGINKPMQHANPVVSSPSNPSFNFDDDTPMEEQNAVEADDSERCDMFSVSSCERHRESSSSSFSSRTVRTSSSSSSSSSGSSETQLSGKAEDECGDAEKKKLRRTTRWSTEKEKSTSRSPANSSRDSRDRKHYVRRDYGNHRDGGKYGHKYNSQQPRYNSDRPRTHRDNANYRDNATHRDNAVQQRYPGNHRQHYDNRRQQQYPASQYHHKTPLQHRSNTHSPQVPNFAAITQQLKMPSLPGMQQNGMIDPQVVSMVALAITSQLQQQGGHGLQLPQQLPLPQLHSQQQQLQHNNFNNRPPYHNRNTGDFHRNDNRRDCDDRRDSRNFVPRTYQRDGDRRNDSKSNYTQQRRTFH